MHIGIFIFRRDLRIYDNLGLNKLMKNCDKILPIFILDKNQIEKHKHNEYYFSNPAIQFICESLQNLDNEIRNENGKLFLFYGNVEKIIEHILKSLQNYRLTICFNIDYSKYSRIRDSKIEKICEKNNVELIKEYSDYTLIPVENLSKNKFGFKQFSAFYKHEKKYSVNKPVQSKLVFLNSTKKFDFSFSIKNLSKLFIPLKNIAQHGGRENGLEKLRKIKNFHDYNENRNLLNYNTTNLSGYLNFGCLSIREVYHKVLKTLGKNNEILKQLYWRDFYLSTLIFLDDAIEYKHMDNKFDKIKWKNNKDEFEKLWYARTGFLLVDSAITEMRESGFCHNRARMILGYFWTKYLLINPYHEKYGSVVGYSKLLLDAITSQNKMNHAWITELDFGGRRYAPKGISLAGRPMDIRNKMIAKFDPDCEYVKKWLPHLKHVNNKDLINWNKDIAKEYENIHPSPMFDAVKRYEQWIKACS